MGGNNKLKSRTTGQVAKLTHITVRTLRYYDQINLLNPSFKEENGRRYYTEEDLFKLEKINLLKQLSLPLDDIRLLIEKISYKQILVSHYNYLQEQLTMVQENLANTSTLLNMMDIEGELSWEQVFEVVKKHEVSPKKWRDYFSEDDEIVLEQTLPRLDMDDKIISEYISILKRIEYCLEHGISPNSDEGHEIANSLIKLSDTTFNGNDDLINKFWEVRKKPSEDTGLYPIAGGVLTFIEECMEFATSK